jgi:hypothetical protein
MIEQGFRPVRVVMAGTADVAVMPAMFVIFHVTEHAGHVHFILPRIFRVAVNADQFRVRALEYKIGIASMIEAGVVPVCGVVTGLALLTAATVMRVILGVTSVACGRRILIGFVLVAVETSGFLMLSDERIVGRVVIEGCVFPLSGLVTVAALRAECFFVHIVVAVTIIAGARRIPMQNIRDMTIPARRILVRAD